MKQLKLYALAALLLLLNSCAKDVEADRIKDQGKQLSFTFVSASEEVEAKSALTRTPGVELLNENNVDRIDVFFYEGQTCLFYPTDLQLQRAGNKVTILVPNATADLLFGKTCTVYILANCNLSRTALAGQTLTALKALTMTNAVDFNPVTFAPQADFLMDSELQIAITETTNDLGTAQLKRAAAKISLEVLQASIPGYTVGEATLTLKHYINTTKLNAASLYAGAQAEYLESTRALGNLSQPGPHLSTPFYSYANNWESDALRESYLILAVPWTKTATNETHTYYYRIPFNNIKSAGETDLNRYSLKRNYIYSFQVKVNALGSLDPDEVVELPCNFTVEDWTDHTIDISIIEYDYLVVFDKNVQMLNTATFPIHFTSSKPTTIQNVVVWCYEYAVNGTITTRTYTPADPEYPHFVINTLDETITITTSIPKNYVPKYITFNVSNTALLKQSVAVTAYPTKYITAQQAPTYPSGNVWEAGSNLGGGTNNPNGASGQTNFNMFTITTTTLSSGDMMPAGVPFNSMPITIGDPTGGTSQTKSDLASNAMMSPQFVVASQRGISSQHTYDNAVLRCQGYQEYPFPRGSWRVPTAAELYYGNKLQNDPFSAVKGLFVAGNNSWWTAYNPYGFNFQSNTLASATEHFIRCVHDIWKD